MKMMLFFVQILGLLLFPLESMDNGNVSIVNAASIDATSFNPLPIYVKAQGSGTPIGTVIAWSSHSNPAEASAWLDCNGQGFSRSSYPELYALIGSRVPDYRGMFLRGVGGNSYSLGVEQEHSVQVSKIGINAGRGTLTSNFAVLSGTGVFKDAGGNTGVPRASHDYHSQTKIEVDLYGNLYNGVATNYEETRPVNVAVRYLIRAK